MRRWQEPVESTAHEVADRRTVAATPRTASFMSLQLTAGNQAVARAVQRQEHGQQQGETQGEGSPGHRPNLDVGDKGPGVALLHQKLRERGYVVGGDQNEFTERTHNAVVRFQSDHPQLHPATGGVGPGTWALLDAPVAAGDVDDTVVKDIIKSALWSQTQGSEKDRCFEAWGQLKARRDTAPKDKPPDVNLAAAEHYMFARYMTAGLMPGMAMDGLAIAYYAFKKTGLRWEAGSGPVTEPSAGQLKWGMLGAHDGAWSTIEADKEIPTTNLRAPVGPKAN